VSLLCSFWKDYDTVVKHMKVQGNPLASIVPGDRVEGEVIAVEDYGVVLRLDNGVQGMATSHLCKGTQWDANSTCPSNATAVSSLP
jgi:ribosomal protein S1